MPISHLLYLHGFRSSPQSAKARQVAGWVASNRPDLHWWCPQLPPSPAQALRDVMTRLADWPREATAVIGSSLGGFYATVVAERLECPAVLLNPAVEPARDLAAWIGETTAWHGGERIFFRPEYVDELRTLRPERITRPDRYFAVIAQGDEVLDWREMAQRYAGCRVKLIAGGDHALSDFPQAHLGDVIDFLGLRG
jgi:predicted esterase YcpF (UPF0227 family)